jgi:hypothetical protein
MSSVHDLHLRSASLSNPDSTQAPNDQPAPTRRGETSGERRLRLLRWVLGDVRAGRDG